MRSRTFEPKNTSFWSFKTEMTVQEALDCDNPAIRAEARDILDHEMSALEATHSNQLAIRQPESQAARFLPSLQLVMNLERDGAADAVGPDPRVEELDSDNEQ